MGSPSLPQPVKLFLALLSADACLLHTATARLEQSYGAVDLHSDIVLWNTSNYYRAEMGDSLLRQFVAFELLISPEEIAQIKLDTNTLESALSPIPNARSLNLDPGYVDANKLVLASTKNQGHRIYIARGIYAEVTLLYHHGTFHPFLYTYTDYRWPETHAFLQQVRKRYLEQTRQQRQRSGKTDPTKRPIFS
jgi:hypothetical protein